MPFGIRVRCRGDPARRQIHALARENAEKFRLCHSAATVPSRPSCFPRSQSFGPDVLSIRARAESGSA